MKILDYIILTIAVLNIALGTRALIEQGYETSIAPYVMGLLLIAYVIITVRTKKRLDRELAHVEDVALEQSNQHKLNNKEKYEQFDKYQATINHWAEKSLALEEEVSALKELTQLQYPITISLPQEVIARYRYLKHDNTLEELYALDITKVNDNEIKIDRIPLIPFNEPQEEIDQLHICDKCSTDKPMRETKCYYICDVCKRRKRKD